MNRKAEITSKPPVHISKLGASMVSDIGTV